MTTCVFRGGCIRQTRCLDLCLEGKKLMKEFPPELYVVIESEPDDDPALYLADSDPRNLSASDGVRSMARYVLAGSGEVVNETKYTETVSHANP